MDSKPKLKVILKATSKRGKSVDLYDPKMIRFIRALERDKELNDLAEVEVVKETQ